MFAVDSALALSHISFGISSPFLWSYYALGGSGSFSNDYMRHLSETRNIRFAAENFMQSVIPVDQNSKAYQVSRMITESTYDGVSIGYMAFGGYNLFKASISGMKNIGQQKALSYKILIKLISQRS
jgi:hypothetical protein